MNKKSKEPKSKKVQVKVRDIKPKKDANGGVIRTSDPCEGGE